MNRITILVAKQDGGIGQILNYLKIRSNNKATIETTESPESAFSSVRPRFVKFSAQTAIVLPYTGIPAGAPLPFKYLPIILKKGAAIDYREMID